ncbi:hypothetical protein ACFL2Q_13900 [Thermodesulfobacteriota bacterium]
MKVLRIVAILLVVLGSVAYGGEPVKKAGVSFSIPHFWGPEGEARTRLCLTDYFEPGLDVVLIDETGTCEAKTGESFTTRIPFPFGSPLDTPVKVTPLTGSKECLGQKAKEIPFKDFTIAIIGAAPGAIRLVSAKEDKSRGPQDKERRARQFVKSRKPDPCSSKEGLVGPLFPIADSPPRVLRFENIALLEFRMDVFKKGSEDNGPPAVYMKDGIFQLCGACTGSSMLFFTLNDRLHLAYQATIDCCRCGDSNFFIYDLSGGSPKKVYWNSDFSN